MSEISKDAIISAIKHCMQEDCDVCTYDGICSSRLFALDSDIIELFESGVNRDDPVKPTETGWAFNNYYGFCGCCKAPLPCLDGL